MERSETDITVGTAAKIGALLFLVWGVLHVWVGYEGAHQYLINVRGQWEMLLGGVHAPKTAFQFPADPLTANVHAHLLLNFCLDVAGYGLLGMALAWLIWKHGSWAAYLIAVIVIGLADNAFLFLQITPGIVELNAATIGGPVLWLLGCLITPFGLPTRRRVAAVTARG